MYPADSLRICKHSHRKGDCKLGSLLSHGQTDRRTRIVATFGGACYSMGLVQLPCSMEVQTSLGSRSPSPPSGAQEATQLVSPLTRSHGATVASSPGSTAQWLVLPLTMIPYASTRDTFLPHGQSAHAVCCCRGDRCLGSTRALVGKVTLS